MANAFADVRRTSSYMSRLLSCYVRVFLSKKEKKKKKERCILKAAVYTTEYFISASLALILYTCAYTIDMNINIQERYVGSGIFMASILPW